MLTFFREGGYIMYPLLLVTIVIAALSVRSWLRLRGGGATQATVGHGIDAILFWGGYAALLGVLGTLLGISQAAAAISQAAEISPSVVWMGIRIALSTTIYGLLVLAIALLLWFALRHSYRKRLAEAAG